MTLVCARSLCSFYQIRIRIHTIRFLFHRSFYPNLKCDSNPRNPPPIVDFLDSISIRIRILRSFIHFIALTRNAPWEFIMASNGSNSTQVRTGTCVQYPRKTRDEAGGLGRRRESAGKIVFWISCFILYTESLKSRFCNPNPDLLKGTHPVRKFRTRSRSRTRI